METVLTLIYYNGHSIYHNFVARQIWLRHVKQMLEPGGYCLVFYSNFTELLRHLYDSARHPCYIPPSCWSGCYRWGVGPDRPLLRRYGQEGSAPQIMLVSDWLLHNMLNIKGVCVRHL